MSGTTQTDCDTGDLSIDVFAREVGQSPRTVRTGCNKGRIPHYKLGTGAVRIPRTYLNELRASAFDDYDEQIKRLVDAAPKLTDAQIDKLSVLLTPAKGRRHVAGKN